MTLKDQIPKDFYKLFSSKYLDYYMLLLTVLYEENSRSYSALGLTEDECRVIMNEQISRLRFDWGEERIDEEGGLLTRCNMASVCFNHFVNWGWLKLDFDVELNSNVISFPEYSQVYVELFIQLCRENDNEERESVLAIYSALFTYQEDKEKNIEILRGALKTSRRLVLLLASMKDGMRKYFDALSKKKDFRGIQEVLIDEIHSSDSKKYAILTTTDSFYRYKEAVKELIVQNLVDTEILEQKLLEQKELLLKGSREYIRNERELARCAEANDLICLIEREFDAIEKHYNRLIEQKTIFVSRAAARIRYIEQNGAEEDQILVFIQMLCKNRGEDGQDPKMEEMLSELSERFGFTSSYHVIKDKSFYGSRERAAKVFEPVSVQKQEQREDKDTELTDFVLKPLYTKRELSDFKQKNKKDGVFQATKETVNTAEDLEKLFFIWQEATENEAHTAQVSLGEELETEDGMKYSALRIAEHVRKS